MRLLVINGPNLNMLGTRNKDIYGEKTYKDLCCFIKQISKENNIKVNIKQFNCEGKIIKTIQRNYNKYDGYIVNLGAYTHYSYAIRDALEIVKCPIIEVHLSDTDKREEFRHISVIKDIRNNVFKGFGFDSYKKAILYLKELIYGKENC